VKHCGIGIFARIREETSYLFLLVGYRGKSKLSSAVTCFRYNFFVSYACTLRTNKIVDFAAASMD
jgi:hypothetical protein